jgi:hypothetical protein
VGFDGLSRFDRLHRRSRQFQGQPAAYLLGSVDVRLGLLVLDTGSNAAQRSHTLKYLHTLKPFMAEVMSG